MARQPDAPAGRQRLIGIAAVAALAAATAVTFARVFVGHAPTRVLVVAALASVAVGALLERRSLMLALVVSTLGLGFALTWLVFPQTAWYGLPTLRTLRAVGRSLDFVAQQARVQVAPTPPLAPLMLAAVTAVWTAAFSTHALALRAGSPLLAVLPSVALVGFADTVLEDGARPTYAIFFLTAVLAVVFVDGLRRVREWGPVWSARRREGLARVAARGAQAVAVVTVLSAVLVPGVLPGFRSPALVDFSTSSEDGIDLDPFVSIQNQLERDEPVDLFEVTTPGAGSYWRLYSLDRFDGTTWSSSDPQAHDGQVLQSPARLPVIFPPAAEPLPQRFTLLTEIDDPWLPMAYPAESVTLPFESLRYNENLGTAVLDGGLDDGLEYTVSSRVVAPTADELELVAFGDRASYGPYTFLPQLDPRVATVAERWTEGFDTPYEKVKAIQDAFRGGDFRYTQDVEPVADSDALLNFLVNTRAGFCQQFATAMAVLVRELGYPARVAVGFREGENDGDRWLVTSEDAHAWVEVYFGPTYGWLPFEPTPTRANPLAEPGTYLNPVASPIDGNPGDPQATLPEGAAGGNASACRASGVPIQLCNSDPVLDDRPGRRAGGGDLPPGIFPVASPAPDGSGYSIPYRWIGVGLGAIVLLLLVFVPLVKWGVRRRALRRSDGPRQLVLAAYRRFDGEAADLGWGRRDGETLDEHRARLSAAVTFSDGHLERLTRSTARAAYGPIDPSTEDADGAVRDARTSLGDLRREAGLVRRVIGTYRPGI